MRAALAFLGANLFLLFMALIGAAVCIALFKAVEAAGVRDDLLRWLTIPIGLISAVAAGLAGKRLHRFLARFI